MARRLRTDGMDISDWQSHIQINWPEAKKAGVRFAYLKATEGEGWADPSYGPRRQECYDNGVIPGAYHFAHPAPGNAIAEAEHFLKVAQPRPGDMCPALDLEVNEHHMSERQLTVWVWNFLSHVYKAIGAEMGWLYTHYDLNRVPNGTRLWASRYNDANLPPSIPSPFRTWGMWQFSDGQFGNPSAIPGVGHVDIDTVHKMFPWAQIWRRRIPRPRPKVRPETPIDRLVRVLKSQVGYHEGRNRDGSWNNIQKYSPAVPGLGWSQGQPWCCTFQSWSVMVAGLAQYFPRTASVRTAMEWFKARNQWSEYPAIGAWCIMGNGEHIGGVVGFDALYVYTVEGNTNNNGSAEGDGVYLKKRLRRDPYVTGYGYPAIPGLPLKTADPNYYRTRSHG